MYLSELMKDAMRIKSENPILTFPPPFDIQSHVVPVENTDQQEAIN